MSDTFQRNLVYTLHNGTPEKRKQAGELCLAVANSIPLTADQLDITVYYQEHRN
jgi:hypothetical protein